MLQLTTQIRLTEQDAQPVLSFIVQVLGDVAQEVEMTGQRGNGALKIFDEVLGGLRHRTVSAAHDWSGRLSSLWADG